MSRSPKNARGGTKHPPAGQARASGCAKKKRDGFRGSLLKRADDETGGAGPSRTVRAGALGYGRETGRNPRASRVSGAYIYYIIWRSLLRYVRIWNFHPVFEPGARPAHPDTTFHTSPCSVRCFLHFVFAQVVCIQYTFFEPRNSGVFPDS